MLEYSSSSCKESNRIYRLTKWFASLIILTIVIGTPQLENIPIVFLDLVFCPSLNTTSTLHLSSYLSKCNPVKHLFHAAVKRHYLIPSNILVNLSDSVMLFAFVCKTRQFLSLPSEMIRVCDKLLSC